MDGEGLTFAMCEYAWTSFDTRPNIFRHERGLENGFMRKKSDGLKFHPTQKPIALYAWLLEKYAKPGYKIFDPMLGSAVPESPLTNLALTFGVANWTLIFEKAEKRFHESIAMPLLTNKIQTKSPCSSNETNHIQRGRFVWRRANQVCRQQKTEAQPFHRL
jgi:hypothetical protein